MSRSDYEELISASTAVRESELYASYLVGDVGISKEVGQCLYALREAIVGIERHDHDVPLAGLARLTEAVVRGVLPEQREEVSRLIADIEEAMGYEPLVVAAAFHLRETTNVP